MKTLLTILICIIYKTTLGQFAIIADKDGFVNVRKSAEISNNIIDTLTNGQVVFCFELEGEWFPVDYELSRQNKRGYIHKSRVKFIEHFYSVPYSQLTDSTITFIIDTLALRITKTSFNPNAYKLQYHQSNSKLNEATYLEKINGKEIWGTDGNVPKMQYGEAILKLGNNNIYLPVDNLFEPNLNYTLVNIDKKQNTIYISTINSDGAGGYAVLWIIENGKFKQRITTIPF